MKFRSKTYASVSAAVAAVGLAVVVQGPGASEPGSPTADPAASIAVPKGPEIDFCPSVEQVALHEERYGFDYKPTVACIGEEEAPSPNADQLADTAADPDENLTRTQACLRMKRLLENATTLQNDSPGQLRGRLPDGSEVIMDVFGDPDTVKGRTLSDEAKDLVC